MYIMRDDGYRAYSDSFMTYRNVDMPIGTFSKVDNPRNWPLEIDIMIYPY